MYLCPPAHCVIYCVGSHWEPRLQPSAAAEAILLSGKLGLFLWKTSKISTKDGKVVQIWDGARPLRAIRLWRLCAKILTSLWRWWCPARPRRAPTWRAPPPAAPARGRTGSDAATPTSEHPHHRPAPWRILITSSPHQLSSPHYPACFVQLSKYSWDHPVWVDLKVIVNCPTSSDWMIYAVDVIPRYLSIKDDKKLDIIDWLDLLGK